MSVEANDVLAAVAIGVGATLVMDLWNLFLKRTFSIPSLNYCLLGRWLRHMPEGTLRPVVLPFFIMQRRRSASAMLHPEHPIQRRRGSRVL